VNNDLAKKRVAGTRFILLVIVLLVVLIGIFFFVLRNR
jgi:hypothetical protein